MDKTKRNTGTRALSAIMAILLALTMCLPSMVFSKEAWAATTTSITATISDLAFLPEYEDAGLGDPTPYVFIRDNKVLIYNMEDSISKVTVDGDESSERGITLRELSEQKSLIDEGLGQGTSLPEEYASAIVDFTNYTPGVYQINVSIYNPRDPSGNSDAVCGLQLTISEGSESKVSLCLTSPDGIMQGVEYNVYKLFDADVDGDGVARNIVANDVIRSVNVNAIEAASSSRPNSSGGIVDKSAIVQRAIAEVGKPFAFGSAGPDGYDTAGFVSYCVSGQNTRIGSTGDFANWEETTTPEPGDICIASTGGYCGIYIGDNQMVFIFRPDQVVHVSDLHDGMTFRIAPADKIGGIDASVSALSVSEDLGFETDQQMAEFIAKNIKDGDELYKDSFGMRLSKSVASAYADNPKFIVYVRDEIAGNDFTNENDSITFSDAGALVCADTMDQLLELVGLPITDWQKLEGKNLVLTINGEEIAVPIKANLGKGTGFSITTASLGDITPDEDEYGDKTVKIEKVTFEGKELPSNVPDPLTTTADLMCSQLDGEGYYLIVRKDALDGEKSVASSPIFVAIHEGENNVEIKAAIPVVNKLIQEDSTDEWGKEADHSVNQTVPYQITGSVAENVDAYSTYKYIFHDVYEADRMTIDPKSIKVAVGGVDADKAAYTVSFGINDDGNDEMTVAFDNLYAVKADLANTDKVVLTYNAIQTGVAAPDGIVNTVNLEYSNNPINIESTGESVPSSCTDYSYAFRIHKTDNSTGESLAGAKFTVQNTNGLYIAKDADGKIIELPAAEDGSIPAGAEWTTDENGFIILDGIDADTYTSIETAAPSDAYDALDAPFTFEINATDRNNIESSIGEHALVNLENDDAISFGSVNVKNIKKIDLPSTGECGLRLLLIIALSVGIAAYIKRRNRKDETASVLTI